MFIGELSKKTGLSRDTIRFYEKQGLIRSGESKSLYNNYKEYGSETLQRLHQIQRIKAFGFTLNEAGSFLEMIESRQASCENVAQRVNEKIALIDQKIAELVKLRNEVNRELHSCSCNTPETSNEPCPIFA